MKRIAVLIIAFSLGIIAGAFGYRSAFNRVKVPEVRIVEKEKIVSAPVVRDYAAMPMSEMLAKLQCYDTSAPRLDMSITGSTAKLSAGLCERNWSRDMQIEVNQSGDWKMYVGVAGIAALAGGYAVYKITR